MPAATIPSKRAAPQEEGWRKCKAAEAALFGTMLYTFARLGAVLQQVSRNVWLISRMPLDFIKARIARKPYPDATIFAKV